MQHRHAAVHLPQGHVHHGRMLEFIILFLLFFVFLPIVCSNPAWGVP